MVLPYYSPHMTNPTTEAKGLPTHLDLPESDGTFVDNMHEHFQSVLFAEIIQPVMDHLHPQGDYCVGQDSGMYWDLTNPPLDGCLAPDWFYVAGVPELPHGTYRRSYVLWIERIPPTLVMEFVSGNGEEATGEHAPLFTLCRGVACYALFGVWRRSRQTPNRRRYMQRLPHAAFAARGA